MNFWKILGIAVLVTISLLLIVLIDLIICYGIMCLTGLHIGTIAYAVVFIVVMFVVTAVLMTFITWLCFKCDRSL